MGKHRITRKQMKKDEFVSAVTRASMYVEGNWKPIAYGAGIVAIIAILAYLIVFYSGYRDERASEIFNKGLQKLHAPVNPGPDAKLPASALRFPTEEEKNREALKSFDTVVNSYGRSKSASIALYYSGLCHMNLGNYDEAISRLEKFIKKETGLLLIDLAKSSLARSYFLKKDFETSARIWKELTEDNQTLYPKADALLNLAKSMEFQGKVLEAKEIYRRIAMEFPGTSSYQEAANKLQS
ncbi:MAG: tetratricopeptide repeat protein [Acidobacteriota bacterium]